MLAPLKKGIEVEVFTGTRQGDVVGMSAEDHSRARRALRV